jgi:glycosidase
MKLFFTSNHDENSWNGTEYEKYGEMAPLFAIFSSTWNGIPLIYSGQEIPNTRRLKFFDKDPLEWVRKPALEDFYRQLLQIRKRNLALKAGHKHSFTYRLNLSNERVMGYLRRNGSQEVIVLLNFNAASCTFMLNDFRVHGNYNDIFTGQSFDFEKNRQIEMDGFGYLVLEKE